MLGRRSVLAPQKHPAPLRKPALRFLVPLVLVGLWLMHGMSAITGAGCHGMLMPVAASATEARSMAGAGTASSMAQAIANTADAATITRSSSGQAGSSELCLSGAPPTPMEFLLALLAGLALLGCVVLAAVMWPRNPRRSRRRWGRGPPGPTGRELLTMVCVTRT